MACHDFKFVQDNQEVSSNSPFRTMSPFMSLNEIKYDKYVYFVTFLKKGTHLLLLLMNENKNTTFI